MEERIVVRPPRPGDHGSVGGFLIGLSLVSRYHRFFSGIRNITAELVDAMLTVTSTQWVLLALDGETVVGHAMAVRADGQAVDIGVVVADAYQYRGVGRRLAHELSAVLTASGSTRVRCDVLQENQVVLEWSRRFLADSRLEPDGETITVCGTLAGYKEIGCSAAGPAATAPSAKPV